jgi:hypothetical protein
MAHKPVAQEFEDNLERDFLIETIDALCDGARGSGVTLTKGECVILLKSLPRVYSKDSPRWWIIAESSFHHEGEGNVEAAIATTMQKYNVSRQTVFDARRRWKEYFEIQARLYSRDESN